METYNNDLKYKEMEGFSQDEKQNQIKKRKQKRLKKIVFSLLGISFFFFLTTVYSQYQVYGLKKLVTSYEVSHPDVPVTPNQIIEAVSRHIILPDTVPQIASIQDAEKLKTTETFFKDVVNGDVVLMYEATIIVYRPTQDLLVAVGPVGGVAK
jgi:hypothetical protein